MNKESRRGRLRALTLSIASVAILGGCGAGTDDTAQQTPSPPPPPAQTPSPPAQGPSPSPAPAGAVTYYFSDCQAGASAGCVPGDDANAGTSATAPRRTLAGLDVNTLPAGSQLLFARGGAWAQVNLSLRNLNATPVTPLVFDSYTPPWGGTARPVLATAAGNAINFGYYTDTVADGGYTLRNLKLDGGGTATWGIFLMGETRNVTLENLDVTGFEIGVYFQNSGTSGNTAVTVRNSDIHHNREMGVLGDANDLVFEGNTIANNNDSGSGFNHGVYLGGHGHNGIVRNNRFSRNSVVNGVCTGGNLTVHGQWDGLLIEGNTIEQDSSVGSCYGISITPGYTSAEYFRNVVVRGNTIVNLGGCAICAGAALAPLIENNLFINRNNAWMSGVVLAANVQAPGIGGDAVDDGAIVRNNTLCSTYLASGTELLVTRNAGTVSQSGNVLRTGVDASTGVCAP